MDLNLSKEVEKLLYISIENIYLAKHEAIQLRKNSSETETK